jgi:hypothetical protein
VPPRTRYFFSKLSMLMAGPPYRLTTRDHNIALQNLNR